MKALLTAFMKAQQEFGTVRKDAKNPAFKSSYASLGSVQDATFDALAKHGLVVLQSAHTNVDDQGRLIVYVGATLHHVESGEQIDQLLGLPVVKADPQGVGSALTYGRRYVLMTLLGLVPDDDDGNAASTQRPAQQYTPPAKAQVAKQAAPPPQPADIDLGMGDDDGDSSTDDAPITPHFLKNLHANLGELYRGMKAAEIEEKRHALVKWVTNGRTTSSKDLTMGECMKLLEAIGDKIRAKSQPQPALDGVSQQPVYN